MTNNNVVGIESIAISLGKTVVTNQDLLLENPGWDIKKIEERTGVANRVRALPGETAFDLGLDASLNLIWHIRLQKDSIDAVIFCTQSPDYVMPPNSALLHSRLGLKDSVMAFDISLACSGFIYCLGIAQSLIISNSAKKVLIVVADTYSKLTHPNDRSTRPLFGDGSAAVLVSACNLQYRLSDISYGTAGSHWDKFIIRNGGSRRLRDDEDTTIQYQNGRIANDNFISMDGLGLLSFFNNAIPKAINKILSKNKKKIDQVDYFIFHQASLVALEGIQRILKIPDNKMSISIKNTGNLVAASIPVLMKEAYENRLVKPGDLVVLCGFGVGLSWGVSICYVE